MEYLSGPTHLVPGSARERYREALEIILQAWSSGPTTYYGKYDNYRYLHVWPKPYQQPHPKLYIMGSGSPETIDLAAELGFGYSVVFLPIATQLAVFERYRSAVKAMGKTATPDAIIIGVIAYVGETDEEAEREGREHILYYFNNGMCTTPHYLAPPGYVTLPEYRKRMERFATMGVHGNTNWETLTKSSRVVCGAPDTVAAAIARWAGEARSSRVICHLYLGDMPHWKTVKNLTLFAEEVMPRVRRLMGESAFLDTGTDAAALGAAAIHANASPS